MLWGIELPNALLISRKLMEKGFIILPAGPNCEVLALTPPYTTTRNQFSAFLKALISVQEDLSV
jgi:4-aminobutyrate aminotransferase-like enzyme